MDGGFESGDSVLTKATAGLDGVLGLTEAIGEPKPGGGVLTEAVGEPKPGGVVLTEAVGEPKPGGVVLTEAMGELAVAWVSPVMVGGLDRGWEKDGGKHL